MWCVFTSYSVCTLPPLLGPGAITVCFVVFNKPKILPLFVEQAIPNKWNFQRNKG